MSRWKMVRLGDICKNLDNLRVPITAKDRLLGNYPYYGASGIVDYVNEFIFDEDLLLVSEDGANLLARVSPIAFSIQGKAWVNNHAHVLRFANMFTQKYVERYLNKIDISKYVTGSAQPKLNQKKLNDINIPLPPLETQKEIAKTIDTAAELLAMRKQQLTELDNLIKSTFYDMFGDPVTNEKGWENSTLGACCNLIKDGPHVSPTYVEDGIPFVSVNNIIKGYWDLEKVRYITRSDYEKFSKKCKPEYGDVLYTKGGTTGYAKYVDRDFEFMNWVHIAVLKYKRQFLNGIFLEKMLNSDYCYNQSQLYTRGIANRDLVLGQMSTITLFVPPLSLQIKFAEIVTKIEEQKALVKKAIDETQYLFDSLMSEYFE